ncbi:transport ATPase [Kaistia sp. 32K]|uniref:MgtC/SapB family protein n=1 Tax=Kaistia sp. 32K TaxID=2795690 RepID=UPI001914DA4D|nr:MgtC/SapB family protein [Kaistia sp. 32K]BCP51786.1 transport ATPase [Kaistia sp. 32K]
MELYLEATLRLGAAAICGLLIGIDRDTREKPAGMRTLALVSLGAAVATLTAIHIPGFVMGSDAMSRVLQGVIQGVLAGIGFIGAGTILHLGQHGGHVQGLTTAATVWVAAALGITCGLGTWPIVLVALVLVLLILIVARYFERWLISHLVPEGRSRDGSEKEEREKG